MKKQVCVLTLGVTLLSIALSMGVLISAQARKASSSGGAGGPGQVSRAQTGDYRLSGPYTHRNLMIFLVHGKNLIKGKSFLTLQEALVQKKVVVYETKSVNELSIRNFRAAKVR